VKVRFLVLLSLFILWGCSSTKHVPQGGYILSDVTIKVDNKKVSKPAILGIFAQKPNKKLLGLPLGVYIYNLSDSTGKTKFKRWMNKTFQRLGEAPAVFDSASYESSLQGVTQYLHSKGYYSSIVTDTLMYRKGKFVSASIDIKAGTPYKLLKSAFSSTDTSLLKAIFKDTASSLLRNGMIFDSDVLERERERIASDLRNAGYYSFDKGYIVFEADSTIAQRQIELKAIIRSPQQVDTASNKVVFSAHEQFSIAEVNVYTNYEPTEALVDKDYLSKFSTLSVNGINIRYIGKPNVTAALVNRSVLVRPNELYNSQQEVSTYENLSALRIFRTINIRFDELNPEQSKRGASTGVVMFKKPRSLVCNIYLTPMPLQAYKLEGELYLSNQVWGIEGSVGYSHINLLKGAERFNLNFNGSLDFLKGNQRETVINKVNRSSEFGVSSSVYIPRFLMPFNLQKRLKLMAPKTQFTGSYNYQSRTYYTRNLISFGFGYSWTSKKQLSISYTPVNLSVIKMYDDDSLKKYLKDKPLLSAAFSDHFISAGILSLVYNNQKINSQDSYFYSILNLEAAGNILYLANPLLKKTSVTSSSSVRSIWGMPFSQYLSSDFTMVYNQRLDSKNRLVYRFQIGAALPYGNSTALPYEKYFFVGGANSLRGWQVRTLGPGASIDTVPQAQLALGDFKLEANLEYRYKLIWSFEGALFLDAGNVWLLPKNKQQDDAMFNFDTFLSQVAANTGVGLRLNLGYLIARFDVGMKLVDPSRSYGTRFLLTGLPKSEYFSYHIGIGYPF
jgi:hypothetical protein